MFGGGGGVLPVCGEVGGAAGRQRQPVAAGVPQTMFAPSCACVAGVRYGLLANSVFGRPADRANYPLDPVGRVFGLRPGPLHVPVGVVAEVQAEAREHILHLEFGTERAVLDVRAVAARFAPVGDCVAVP